MKIQLGKFGSILVSRPAGKEAWLAFQPILNEIPKDERVFVDFSDVAVLTPSWADEFLTPLQKKFKNKVALQKTTNPSIVATLKLLKSLSKPSRK